MLTQGTTKLGKSIWVFSLPSARKKICIAMTETCRKACYDRRLESFRPSVRKHRWENYRKSLREDFVQRMLGVIDFLDVATLRVHGGGEVYSVAYARKWLAIMRARRRTRFYLYTRAWRDEAIRPILEKMARLKNVRIWYSLDAETGMPARVPRRVRLAWLMTSHDEEPPADCHLAFRTQFLRKRQATRINGVRVCPSEDGVERRKKVVCGSCNLCYRELPAVRSSRGLVSLPILNPS